MSGSLHKKRNTAQKQNSQRLSNSKIISAYNPSLSKINCSEFFSVNEDKSKCPSRKTGRFKTTRKHQLSVEFLLHNKSKETNTLKTIQLQKQKGDKNRQNKTKKKKKELQSHEESRFVVPVLDFSRSNSLIVFSEKDSTIHPNPHKEHFLYFRNAMNPTQAAVLIQKTWRGYLTRKLLQQYINQEQHKIETAIYHLKSKEESFFAEEEKPEDMNFSEFSSIQEDTVAIGCKQEVEWSIRKQGEMTTSKQSNTKEKHKCSPTLPRNFFKNHKTDPNFSEDKNLHETQISKRCQTLSMHPSVYNISVSSISEQPNLKQFLLKEPLCFKIESLKGHIEQQWQSLKKELKQSLSKNELGINELAQKSNHLKEIYQNSQEFLDNVMLELDAIISEMKNVLKQGAEEGTSEEAEDKESPAYQPKREIFTIEVEDNEPLDESIKNHFSDGQIKLQTYLKDLIQDYHNNFPDCSEVEYLCQVLKINSERGVKTITERCLLQFTVQTITSNHPLHQLSRIAHQQTFSETEPETFMVKWINELNKWEMGPIQEVTQAMESSSFINGQISKSLIYQ